MKFTEQMPPDMLDLLRSILISLSIAFILGALFFWDVLYPVGKLVEAW